MVPLRVLLALSVSLMLGTTGGAAVELHNGQTGPFKYERSHFLGSKHCPHLRLDAHQWNKHGWFTIPQACLTSRLVCGTDIMLLSVGGSRPVKMRGFVYDICENCNIGLPPVWNDYVTQQANPPSLICWPGYN